MPHKTRTYAVVLLFVLAGLGGGLLYVNHPLVPVHRDITIQARRFAFDPGTITVNKGDTVTITLVSEDVTHGFYLAGYGINKTIAPWGNPSVVTFVADKTGMFNFRCSHTCGPFHPFMIGKLIVKPNYTAGGTIGLTVGLLLGMLYFFSQLSKVSGERGGVHA